MKWITLILLSLILLPLSSALNVDFVSPTPSNGSTINTKNVEIVANITSSEAIDSIVFNWNGTNFSSLDKNVILYYNFENISSIGEDWNTIKDISIYGNNATIYGNPNITLINNGIYGNAFNFSGYVNYLNITSNLEGFKNKVTNSFTISFWANAQDIAGTRQLIKIRNVTNDLLSLDYTAGYYRLILRNLSGSWSNSYGAVTTGNKHNVITFNGSTASHYIDGVLIQSRATGGFGNLNTSFNEAYIGYSTLLTRFYNGTLDEFIILNKSISQTDVNSLYHSYLIKTSNSSYTFWINASNTTVSNQYYQVCSINSSSTICTYPNLIRHLTNLNINYNSIKSIINPYFYGIQGYDYEFYSGGKLMNSACSQVLDNNYTQTRNAFAEAGFKILRYEVSATTVLSDYTINTSIGGDEAEIIKWAYDNNYKINLLINYVPEWLTNKTDLYCTSASNYRTCRPYNYTKYGDVVVNLVNNLTANGTYASAIQLEIFNEPYGGQWLNNLSTDNLIKATEYIKLYNATYDSIKIAYPTMSIGPSTLYYNLGKNMTTTILSNVTNKWDTLYIHQYTYSPTDLGAREYYSLNTAFTWLMGLCSTYSANCSNLYLSEWNLIANSGDAMTNLHGLTTGYNYEFLLNNYAPNITSVLFTMGTYATTNLTCDSNYNYTAYNSFTNARSYTFNITKQFATYHPSGASVVTSSSDYSPLKVVASKRVGSAGQMQYSITLINTDTDSINATIDADGIINLTRQDNGVTYYSSGGTINLGVLESYDVITYRYDSLDIAAQALDEICTGAIGGLDEFANLIPIVIIVIIAGSIILLINGKDIDLETSALMIFFTLIVVVVGGIVISKMSSGC